MKIASFDLLDTALTRDVAHPSDIFLAVGIQAQRDGLDVPEPREFLQARVKAELEARRRASTGEVILREIYAILAEHLVWNEEMTRIVEDIELAVESKSLRRIPCVAARINQARQAGAKVVFLTDMYLPSSFFRDVLKREGLFQEGDEIFASGECRASKASGRLYQIVRERIGATIAEWAHLGDNAFADVEMAERNGVKAEWFSQGRLNAYERGVIEAPADGSLWKSRLGAAMRMARLDKKAVEPQPVLWDTGCDVAAPLLFGFVHWCLEEAEREGIKRLYFVARDGQILEQIARKIVASWNYNIECRYLCGSRQAWHPASIGTLESEDFHWIMAANKFLSLRELLSRVGLKPEPFSADLTATGLPEAAWDRNLSKKERARAGDLLWKTVFKTAIEIESRRRRKLVVRYLRQEGFFDGTSRALVDIGWHGNMQKSLAKILELEGENPALTGLYFGLMESRRHNRENRLIVYSNQFLSRHRVIRAKEQVFLEIFVTADHGSVVGFEEANAAIRARLNGPRNSRALEWGIGSLQESVRVFAGLFCELTTREEAKPEALFQIGAGGLERLVYRPTPEEARAFGSFQFSDDQTESTFSTLVPDWPVSTAWRAVFQKSLRPCYWWHEGFLTLRPTIFLRLYLALFNLKESWSDFKRSRGVRQNLERETSRPEIQG